MARWRRRRVHRRKRAAWVAAGCARGQHLRPYEQKMGGQLCARCRRVMNRKVRIPKAVREKLGM